MITGDTVGIIARLTIECFYALLIALEVARRDLNPLLKPRVIKLTLLGSTLVDLKTAEQTATHVIPFSIRYS